MLEKRYLIGLSFVILFSAGFIYLTGILRPSPVSSVVQKEKFWADKVHSKKKYAVIVAGDSRVYRGIDPQELSNELGNLAVLNFGFSSGGFNDLIFSEINSKLLTDATNRIIVLGITPYSLTPKAQENIHFLQEKNRTPEEVFTRRFVNPFLSFFDPIKPTDLIQNTDTISGYHEVFNENGWVASYKLPSNPEAALKSYERDFENNRVQRELINDLCRQISVWRKSGILIFAFRVPSTASMERLENKLSGFDEDSIKSNVVSSGGIWLDIANKYGYESYDGSHLSERSAVSFSKYLGKRIFESINMYTDTINSAISDQN